MINKFKIVTYKMIEESETLNRKDALKMLFILRKELNHNKGKYRVIMKEVNLQTKHNGKVKE